MICIQTISEIAVLIQSVPHRIRSVRPDQGVLIVAVRERLLPGGLATRSQARVEPVLRRRRLRLPKGSARRVRLARVERIGFDRFALGLTLSGAAGQAPRVGDVTVAPSWTEPYLEATFV